MAKIPYCFEALGLIQKCFVLNHNMKIFFQCPPFCTLSMSAGSPRCHLLYAGSQSILPLRSPCYSRPAWWKTQTDRQIDRQTHRVNLYTVKDISYSPLHPYCSQTAGKSGRVPSASLYLHPNPLFPHASSTNTLTLTGNQPFRLHKPLLMPPFHPGSPPTHQFTSHASLELNSSVIRRMLGWGWVWTGERVAHDQSGGAGGHLCEMERPE